MNKKMKISDTMYDVVSLKEYTENKDVYVPRYTAIHDEENGIVLPVKTQTTEDTPCIEVGHGMSYELNLDDHDLSEFDEKNIIDLDNSKSINELMKKQEAVRDLERDILTSPDNLFKPKIFDDDSGEMKALKTAVNMKEIDLDKYAPRFGANYNNDKRLFNKSSISLTMLKRMCDALDIDATLILRDKDPNVPNPIGDEIEVKLTGVD